MFSHGPTFYFFLIILIFEHRNKSKLKKKEEVKNKYEVLYFNILHVSVFFINPYTIPYIFFWHSSSDLSLHIVKACVCSLIFIQLPERPLVIAVWLWWDSTFSAISKWVFSFSCWFSSCDMYWVVFQVGLWLFLSFLLDILKCGYCLFHTPLWSSPNFFFFLVFLSACLSHTQTQTHTHAHTYRKA